MALEVYNFFLNTEIFLLIFADDLPLISDTIVGLQRLLDLLNMFCVERNLVVNTLKTKVIVFQNGDNLSKKEITRYAGELIEVVLVFTYVGVYFTRQLSLRQTACEQTVKAKRVLVSVLNQLFKHGQMSKQIFFKKILCKSNTNTYVWMGNLGHR